jgi:hypothetical protein
MDTKSKITDKRKQIKKAGFLTLVETSLFIRLFTQNLLADTVIIWIYHLHRFLCS